MHKNSSHIKFHILAFALLAVIIGFLYSNTFHSPFIFDDVSNIQQNLLVKQTDLSWEAIKKVATASPNKRRMLPNISFALNYLLDGSNVWGYHLVNIMVHICVAFVFYLLARTTLALPINKPLQRTGEIAFMAALVWAIHPLQTNGVTYIVQRMTSMATLFFLLSLLCYAKGRIHDRIDVKKIILFGAAAVFGIMAMLSKEISGMLPLVILGYEFLFLRQTQAKTRNNKKILLLYGSALIIFIMICFLFLGSDPLARILNDFNHRQFTLSQRLLSESRIIFHYLSLLIMPLPSRLNLSYDYQLSYGLMAPPQTLLAIIGLTALVWLFFFFYKRDRLLGFAIFWFLANLLIESSFIALELIFEHRMYMPSMFLILAFVTCAYRAVPQQVNAARMSLFTLAVLLAFFTWQRNTVWQNEITLWTDVVQKAPGSLRGHANLGVAYNEAKKYDMAQKFLKEAIAIGQNDRSGNFSPVRRQKFLAKAHDGLGMIYRELKRYPQAIYEANLALQMDPTRPGPLVTLGVVYAKLDQHQKAYDYFRTAQARGLASVDLYNNWAVSSFNLGMVDQAISLLQYALQLDPEHSESHYNLGIAYSSKGMLEEAQREMNAAMRLRGKTFQGQQSRF